MRQPNTLFLMMLVPLFLLAGCGEDEESGEDETAPPSQAEREDEDDGEESDRRYIDDPTRNISERERVQELLRIREICGAFASYAADHNGRFPDHAEDLIDYIDASDRKKFFLLPYDDGASHKLFREEPNPTKPYTYGSFTFMPLSDQSFDTIITPSRFPVAYSSGPRWVSDDRFRIVGFADSSVRQVPEYEFKKMRVDALDMLAPKQ